MSNDIKKLLESIDSISKVDEGDILSANGGQSMDNGGGGMKPRTEPDWKKRSEEDIDEGSTHNGTYYDTHIDMKMYDLGVEAFKEYLTTGEKNVPEFRHRDQKTAFEQGWNDCVLKKNKYGKSKFMALVDKYLSRQNESTEVDEGVKWNSFKRWYDESPKDVITRARKADTNFLKNVVEVDPRDLGGAAKLQWMAARKELERRGEKQLESKQANINMKKTTNESVEHMSDPVVICMTKDDSYLYFAGLNDDGTYNWSHDKAHAKDFESEHTANHAIHQIKSHDSTAYKMGHIGKAHGEKSYPIYTEPLHEIEEDASPLTWGDDNLDMDEDWSANEYNRQKMIDAPKSRQHNPVSAPGEHSFIPRTSHMKGGVNELDEEDDNGQDEIIQDLSGHLQGDWPLGDHRDMEEGIDTDPNTDAMDADPDSIVGEGLKDHVRNAYDKVANFVTGDDIYPGTAENPSKRQIRNSEKGDKERSGKGMQRKVGKDYGVNEYYDTMVSKGIEKMPKKSVRESMTIDEVSAPGQEDWIKANKEKFVKEYGQKKGLEVLYASAWKRSKKNESIEGYKHFESLFNEAMGSDIIMTKKTNKKLNESFDLTDAESTKKIVDSLGSMMKLAGIQSQYQGMKPLVSEDLSATLTMTKSEPGCSTSLTLSDPMGDELDKLLSLSGLAQPEAHSMGSTEVVAIAPESESHGMMDEDAIYSNPDQDPTGEYGDTHEYSNRPKKDVYDLDTQLNKGSDLNAPKGEYAKEFPGDNRMNTAKRDAAFESKDDDYWNMDDVDPEDRDWSDDDEDPEWEMNKDHPVKEGWMDKFKKVINNVGKVNTPKTDKAIASIAGSFDDNERDQKFRDEMSNKIRSHDSNEPKGYYDKEGDRTWVQKRAANKPWLKKDADLLNATERGYDHTSESTEEVDEGWMDKFKKVVGKSEKPAAKSAVATSSHGRDFDTPSPYKNHEDYEDDLSYSDNPVPRNAMKKESAMSESKLWAEYKGNK